MSYFFEQILNGLASGTIYASLALAIVLIFKISNLANFGQGEMATFSAFLLWQFDHWGVPLVLALVLVVAVSAVLGAILYGGLIRPVQNRDHLTIVLVTIGIFLAFNSLSGFIWGYLPKSVPNLYPSGGFYLGTVKVPYELLGLLLTLALVATVLYVVFQTTRIGIAFRAAASNPESSQLVGIPPVAMGMLGWAIAAAVGALSAAMIAPRLTVEPNMMLTVLIYAFAAAVIGGLDSYPGALVGGIAVGVSQTMSTSYLPALGADLQVVVPFALIVMVLVVKPAGLFGKVQVARV